MMFLLRLVFWITLICLLLPTSREDNRRIISSAEQTVSDVKGFCQRNPRVCDDARVTMTAVLAKLRSGTEMLQSWLSQKDKRSEVPASQSASASRDDAPRPQGAGEPQPLKPVTKWQDSLNPADKQVPWHGPQRL